MATVLYFAAVAVVLWIVLTEGTYCHRSLTKWFYHRGAAKYDLKWNRKSYRKDVTESLWVSSIRTLVTKNGTIRMLDACCGTGRVAKVLATMDWFSGSIDAFDCSPDMLAEFENWRQSHCPKSMQITIKRSSMEDVDIDHLQLFDVVTLLECSELIPNVYRGIQGPTKQLRPGGLLILTKTPDWLSYFFPGRCQHSHQLRPFLESIGFQSTVITPWRWRYEMVTAWKSKSNLPNV